MKAVEDMAVVLGHYLVLCAALLGLGLLARVPDAPASPDSRGKCTARRTFHDDRGTR